MHIDKTDIYKNDFNNLYFMKFLTSHFLHPSLFKVQILSSAHNTKISSIYVVPIEETIGFHNRTRNGEIMILMISLIFWMRH
jgi:hypothetical protein